MRIELVARAALTVLVMVGVGAAGCSEDEPEKGPVITTTAPSATAPPKPKATPQKPNDAFENVAASGSITTSSQFVLTGYIRNTGNANGTFEVIGRGEDAGIAVFSDTDAVLDVPNLAHGLATKFKITAEGRDHKSVRWTYWAVIDGGAPGDKYGISFAF